MEKMSSKSKVLIAYIIPLLGLIFYYVIKDSNEEEKKEYKQSGTIFIILAVISLISNIVSFTGIPYLGLVLNIVNILLIVFSIVAGVTYYQKGIHYDIPAISDISDKIFK